MKVQYKQVCTGCGKEYFPALEWKHAKCRAVANSPILALDVVANEVPEVANKEVVVVANNSRRAGMSDGSRHGKYKDLEVRRVYMRELMRKRRGACLGIGNGKVATPEKEAS